jgi:hypothetical protein
MGILCIYRRCSSIGLDKGTAIRSDGNLGCVLSWRLMELRYGEEVEACIWRLNGEQTCFRTGYLMVLAFQRSKVFEVL